MRSRASLEQERYQLERARAHYIRWGGALDHDYFDLIGARLTEVRRLINELEKETDDQHRH